MYEMTVDLMDKKAFPHTVVDIPKRNPRYAVSTPVKVTEQSNEEIVEYVVNQMKNTLGS
jgi:hypothetical protein